MSHLTSLLKQRRTRSDSIGPATTPDIESPSTLNFNQNQNHNNSSNEILNNNNNNSNTKYLNSSKQFVEALNKNVIKFSNEFNIDASTELIDEEEEEEEDVEDNNEMLRIGWIMLICSLLSWIFGFWSIAIGPFLNKTEIYIFDKMAQDEHYKYLIIFFVPVTLYAVIINWWGLKIFRHA